AAARCARTRTGRTRSRSTGPSYASAPTIREATGTGTGSSANTTASSAPMPKGRSSTASHIDPAFSAFHPPEDDIDAINARMTTRSQARAEVARRWEVGADYRDETLRSVRIVGSGSPHALAE